MFSDSHSAPLLRRAVILRRGLWAVSAALLFLGLLAGCGRKGEEASGSSAKAPPAGGGAGAAAIQAPGKGGHRPPGFSKMPAVTVAVATARKGDISSFYSATATLEAQKQAQVLARVQGVVSGVEAEEGDEVAKGQELMRIENKEYLYRLREAEANHAKLKAKYDRVANMVEQHLVSVEDFETARSELESAKAEEDLARLTLSYTKVLAPFAGHVIERFIDLGQNLSPGNPLYTVADFHPLRARIHVPAREFRHLCSDQPVELILDSSGIHLQGKITLISPVIDASSGTIKVTVEIDDFPAGVRPGDFAQVKVVTQQRQGRVLIPRQAVVSEKGEDVVFVAVDGQAQVRPVELGFRDDVSAEILSGVENGEQVVVKGQGKLRKGQPLTVVEVDGEPVPPQGEVSPGGKATPSGRRDHSPGKAGGRPGSKTTPAAKGSS